MTIYICCFRSHEFCCLQTVRIYRPTTTPRQGQEEVHNQPEGVPHQDFEVGFDVDNFVEENPLTIKHQHTFTCNFVVLRFVASIEANSVHVSGHCQS